MMMALRWASKGKPNQSSPNLAFGHLGGPRRSQNQAASNCKLHQSFGKSLRPFCTFIALRSHIISIKYTCNSTRRYGYADRQAR